MRRDYFTLDVDGIGWVDEGTDPSTPTLVIDFAGPSEDLRERLTGFDDDLLDAEETDVALRLQSDLDDDEATGVVSVTNRVTGDFVLELNESAADIIKFIRAARRYGEEAGSDNGRYLVRILIDDEEVIRYEKSTFLVYNTDGELLRQHSLIPSGVEL